MKPENELHKLSKVRDQARKPRFRIEKLEERIAPHHRLGHHRGPSYNCRLNPKCDY